MGASKKSKWAAGLLSALFPGIGHLYAGAMQRGLFFMLLLIGDIFGVVLVSMEGIVPLIVLLSILIPVIYFYSLFDALQTIERINQRELLRVEHQGVPNAVRPDPSNDSFARFALLVGVLACVGIWLADENKWLDSILDQSGPLIVAGAFIAAGVIVFVFGGKGK